MSDTVIASSETGALFTIPRASWQQVHDRVSLCLSAENIQNVIAQSLPDFPSLIVVCKTWRDKTEPGLVEHAENVAAYAQKAIDSFTTLNRSIATLEPSDPLPDATKTQAETTFRSLDDGTTTLRGLVSQLSDQLIAFQSTNARVDAQVAGYQSKLGPYWQSIADANNALESATGQILGAWEAIGDDVALVVREPDRITTSFLLGLDIQAALGTWTQLKNEATAFPSEHLALVAAARH